ncbi:MAG: hypothetical protein ACK5L0_05875 [Candidatus Fimivivens sp.]
MKKLSITALAAACCLLAACGSGSASPSPSDPIGDPNGDNTSSIADTPTSGDVLVGLGVVSTTSESTSASGEIMGNANFNVVVCALSTDTAGTILDVKFDTLQADVGFDISGMLTGDMTSEIETKKELGDAYGMKDASGIQKEWYEQIAALEDWMRGKTVDDVLLMKVTERDAEHQNVPDETDLKTSVTISVTDQLRALEKAYSDTK